MTERTRTYTGTLPVNPAHDAWQQAHDEQCLAAQWTPPECDHTNPHPETMAMLVHVFEREVHVDPFAAQTAPGIITGIQVAVHNGEPGRMSRWTPPATMTEET